MIAQTRASLFVTAVCLMTPITMWGQDQLKVKAMRAAPRQTSLYEITFTTTETLAADAEIRVMFPSTYDLGGFEIAGSTTINGGFTFKREGQRVTIQRTGLGSSIPRGQKVSLQLGLIKNPPLFANAEPVRIEVLHSRKATTAAKAFTSSVEFQAR